MQKFLRLLATASLSGLIAFAATVQGCSDTAVDPNGDTGEIENCEDPNDYKTCTCEVKSDCTPLDPSKAKYFVCTPRKSCVKICITNSDCASGESCEDSQCRPPACGADSECGANEQCISGKCEGKLAATAVASCVIQPSKGITHAGATKNFSVVAKDASGKVIPYHGDVTWGATGDVGTAGDATFTTVFTGAATAGTGTLTAKIGSTDCTAANITNFAAVANGDFRVVVASFADQSLISGAKVVVNDQEADTDASGAATFQNVTTPATVSVFSANYSYVTYVGVTTTDVAVFVKPGVQPGKLTGAFTPRSFDDLQDVRGTVHLAINGPSIAGNVLDLSLNTLLGESVETTIDLGGSTKVDAPLPDGIVIGLAENMFKGSFSIQSSPGLRAGWSLGGNVVLSDVLGVVSQATGGGDIDIGAILSALLPVIGRLQAGAFAGLEFKANETGTLPAGFRPTLPLRLTTKVKVPEFPTYKVGEETKNFEGAIILGGALYGNQGLVPLGLSAGIDKDKNGKVDATGMGGTEGEAALRLAPQNGGIEGSKYVALTLAASFSGLLDDSGDNGPLVLSGRLNFPGDILFKNNATNTVNFGDGVKYLSVPDSVEINEGTRTLTVSALAGADLMRLDLGSEESEWQIFFAPGTTTVTVPAVPASVTDRFEGDATLQVVSLKNKNGLDYQGVISFSSDNADDLTPSIDAFAARGIERTSVE